MRLPSRRLLGLYGAAAAFVLVPFVLFGRELDAWTLARLQDGTGRSALALLIASLLCADVVLPVPSSILSTTAGWALGFAAGALVTFSGMSAGCLLGYALGRFAGSVRAVGPPERDALRRQAERYGIWGLAVARPVPVLAEASVLLSGAAHMNFRRFLLVTTSSNAGISLVYAAAGAFSATVGSFFLALAAALALPFLAMHTFRRPSGLPVEETVGSRSPL